MKHEDKVLSHLEGETRECPACGSEMTRMLGDKYSANNRFDWVCTNSDCRAVVDIHPDLREMYREFRSYSLDERPFWNYEMIVAEQEDHTCDEIRVKWRHSRRIEFSELEQIKEIAERVGYDFIQLNAEEGYLRIVLDDQEEEVKE